MTRSTEVAVSRLTGGYRSGPQPYARKAPGDPVDSHALDGLRRTEGRARNADFAAGRYGVIAIVVRDPGCGAEQPPDV